MGVCSVSGGDLRTEIKVSQFTVLFRIGGAPMIAFLKAHKRAIVISLVCAYAAYLLIYPDEFGRIVDLIFFALLLTFIASQLFWVGRLVDLGERFLPGKPRRGWLALVAGLVYLFFYLYSYPSIESTNVHVFRAADWRLSSVIIEATFWWWLVGSLAGFVLVIFFGIFDRAVRGAAWVYRKARTATPTHASALEPESIPLDPPSPSRRRFLEQTAVLVSATPFVASAYGLLYERLDVEVTHPRIWLPRLPKAFEGFRIAQLSDIHISPFTTADQIRRCVTIANGTKADLIVITGDYISWDPEAQGDVVSALAELRAPFGVFGCLGNHEQESGTEESITRLFAAKGIRMLRQERAPIRLGGDTLNLIGMDESRGQSHSEWQQDVHRRLRQVKDLMMPGTVNILLVHYPNVFDYVTELGIDLTLAGHTHGGQLSVEFIHRGLSLAHLDSPYDSGLYEKAGSQLYVNRGIGTTGFPIRFGARPEITLFELTRLTTG
jgi:uncharacterized protein